MSRASRHAGPDDAAFAPGLPGDNVALVALLRDWAACHWLRPLDAAFAAFLARETPDAPPALILAAALASHQLGRGHACLDIEAVLQDPALALSLPPEDASPPADDTAVPMPDEVLAGLTANAWLAALNHPALVGDGAGDTPLVRIGRRLYLRRYWQYERNVRAGIEQRLAMTPTLDAALPIAALRGTLNALFPRQREHGHIDWQKMACALAARSGFAVVTGGPGTGKTTTVVRLLALLQALTLASSQETASRSPRHGMHGVGGDAITARPLRIRLAAPTGKAAARLNESIAGAVKKLPLSGIPGGESVRQHIPTSVTTLHRLLGSRPDTRRFRHHADNPLSLDVLVVDEASMVDLEMMAAVLAALPRDARLILLGDKDQLASVEAGAVLGQLCQRARHGHYTADTVEWLGEATGQVVPAELMDAAGTALDQAVVMLRHSHRFSSASGIGQLADAVNGGEAGRVDTIWRQGHVDIARLKLADVHDARFDGLVIDGGDGAKPTQGSLLDQTSTPRGVTGDLFAGLEDEAAEAPVLTAPANPSPSSGSERQTDTAGLRHGYRHYLETLRRGQPAPHAPREAFDTWAGSVLRAHGAFQVLCALRRGPWGVEGLNLRIARGLQQAGLIEPAHEWYLGRPVLVTRNDYSLGLMNGDIGITLALPAAQADEWVLRVAFPATDGQGGIKWILPSRLQEVETVYALTVHKSQGSEFSHVALVMPDKPSPILTRELVYTGITRARQHFTLIEPGGKSLLAQAVQRRVLRASGLSDGAGEQR